MSCGRVLLMRGAIADMAIQNDQGGSVFRLPEILERALDATEIVSIANPHYVPAVSEKSGRDVFREGDARIPLDGDVVVVVNPAEFIQAQMTGKRCCFRRNAFHQAAVAANGINIVAEDLEARPVVSVGKPLLCDRHAHARSYALPERSGRGLDP